jgi:osmotically-inducible protein OsmY
MSKTKRAAARQADCELAAAATNAIKWLTTIPAEAIHITAHDGHLDLDGQVEALHQRTVIEDLARALPGVRGVTNSIYVAADPVFADVRAVLQ